jgi:hypothetical protein
MKEWIALESNKIEASNPSVGAIPITTSNPHSISLGTST